MLYYGASTALEGKCHGILRALSASRRECPIFVPKSGENTFGVTLGVTVWSDN